MKDLRIPTLNSYVDWLEKAKYELSRYEESCGVYDMANCFLTLNAIPEWIEKSNEAPSKLINVAQTKISIMKGVNFNLDENKLDELDHQLRLIRVFCNHSKHGDPKEKLKHISMSFTFPQEFPLKFELLSVGSKTVKAYGILNNVISFWSREIENA